MKNSKLIISLFLFLCSFLTATSENTTLIQNVASRNTTSLNGQWNYIIDPYETGYSDYRQMPYDEMSNPGNSAFFLDKKQTDKSELIEYSFDKSPTLSVPGDWNSQDMKLLYYEGTIWYRCLFDYKKTDSNNRIFVYFGAINYESDVYLNGKKLGKHIGGFTPFNYEVTNLLKEKDNSLVVRANNKRKPDAVPSLNTDWWNYGGITRDVSLVEVSKIFIQDYFVQLKKSSENEITGFVQLNGAKTQQTVKVSIPELKVLTEIKTDSTGKATFTIIPKKINRWSPENPKLYEVEISCNDNKVTDKIGFRTIETRGTEILLNGKSVFLRGICIHEENQLRGGRAFSAEDAKLLLNATKELNCNYVRLAHYPHSEYMLKLADEMGILVWEENPVYWTLQWENPKTQANAAQQLADVISRDKNRASVIIWSIANEAPLSDARTEFLKKLIDNTRSLDNTRLISAALEIRENPNNKNEKTVLDPIADYIDIISFNQYVGWYGGTPEKCDSTSWTINYKKPVMISEFGGSALQGMHGDAQTRFTEEYQQDLYIKTLKMLSKIPQFRGVSPWILFDFRSPKRLLPNIQDGWNRKGIIGQNGNKKEAFYILKAYYDQMEIKYKEL